MHLSRKPKPNQKPRFFLQNLPKPTDRKHFETVTTLMTRHGNSREPRNTSVKTEPRPRHEKPCLETWHVSQDSLTVSIYFPYYNITVGLHISTALQFNTDCEAILAAFIWPDVYVQSLRLPGLPGVLFLTGQSGFLAICLVKQEGQYELTGQRVANFRRDLGAT